VFKRATWFGIGAVAGFSTAVYGYVRARESADRFAPDRVADTMVGAARVVGGTVRDALAESREAVREVEGELRATYEPKGRRQP
jgi:hypothetical protein